MIKFVQERPIVKKKYYWKISDFISARIQRKNKKTGMHRTGYSQ